MSNEAFVLVILIFFSFSATDIIKCYKDIVGENLDISVPVASIKALTQYIQANRANTMIEFTRDLEAATKTLLSATQHCVSIKAGCELFTRFVTRSGADTNEVYFYRQQRPLSNCCFLGL